MAWRWPSGKGILRHSLVIRRHTEHAIDRITDCLPMRAGYFKLIAELVGTTPMRRQALLEGTGIAADAIPDEITAGQQLQQLRNAHRLMPAGWGLAVGAQLRSETHGSVGFGAVSAPTLGAALALVERFVSVRNPNFGSASERRGGDYRLVFKPRFELLEEERLPLVETYFLSVQAIAEAVLVHRLERGHIEIIGRPAHARLYRDYFHVEVRFDAEQDALCLPLELLDQRSPLTDADMYESSVRSLEQLAERLSGERFVAARVADLIASSSDSGLPMEAAAKLLGVSPRTLIRRLHDSGTSYRELRDGHRRRRASTLLETTTLTMAEIATRLGYEDPSNFARACHRWFGCAPGAMRERLGDAKAGDAIAASDFRERSDALDQRGKSSVIAKAPDLK